ncbi:MAG: hypothetical protein R3300_15905, partial [Candidatus Promineifilaceae bacterium]|nr:hypothetical protein [Candidatus Promineifilaceae bacterium]
MGRALSDPASWSRSRFRRLMIVGLPGAVAALILYWPALQLPLLYDDLLHIRITAELNLLTVWLPTESFGFYRPLTFFPLLIIDKLFGHYPAALLHGLNVVQHALNAALVAWLSWRLWRRAGWAIASGLLLALFPFAYQAVAVYGHNVHPSVTGLLLLGLHGYLSAIRRTGSAAGTWLTTGLFFLLALLSHESAILFGPLAALVDWNETGRLPGRSWRAWRRPWLLFTLLGGVYLVGYQFLPLTRAPQAEFEAGALSLKGLYVLQTAAYPVAWLVGRVPGLSGASAALISFYVTVALTALALREARRRLGLLLGWTWWALAAALVAVPLSAGYLLHGPRLLYLSGAGLALLWPQLLTPPPGWRRAGPYLAVVAVVGLLLANWIFVRDRLEAYQRLTAPVDLVERIMADRPADEGIVLVNLPSWLAPAETVYPVGVEFVSMLGGYLFAEELIGFNLGDDHPVRVLSVPDRLQSWDYSYGIHEQGPGGPLDADWASAGSHVFLTDYGPNGPVSTYRGRLLPAGSASPVAAFGPYALLRAR